MGYLTAQSDFDAQRPSEAACKCGQDCRCGMEDIGEDCRCCTQCQCADDVADDLWEVA